MPLFQVTQPAQQVGHLEGHRGLSRPRVASEAHVQVRPGGLEAEPLPYPVDEQQRGDLLHLLLDRDQADQLPVQGGEYVLDIGRPAFLGQAYGRLGGWFFWIPPPAGKGNGEFLFAPQRHCGGPEIFVTGLRPCIPAESDRHRQHENSTANEKEHYVRKVSPGKCKADQYREEQHGRFKVFYVEPVHDEFEGNQ